MTIDEIRALLRAALDIGDNDAFLAGLRLFHDHHPEKFQEFMVEVQRLANTPGGLLQ